MKIRISQQGDFSKSIKFLTSSKELRNLIRPVLEKYGQMGVDALREATPKDTGKTSESWSYSIEMENGVARVIWSNSNVSDWANVAVLIQYGHATRNGGYVEGIDYINPAMSSIFEKMAQDIWKEVAKKIG